MECDPYHSIFKRKSVKRYDLTPLDEITLKMIRNRLNDLEQLQDDVKTCLFRVTRELLTNVVKHARAQRVKVSVRKTPDEIHVTVRDDGVGFNPAEVKGEDSKTVRFGLFSVREQLEYLGGCLIIESKPGRGTVATVII